MSTKRLIIAALLLAPVAPAFADDPIYVVRPPIMQLRANVLPANAFGGSSTPSQPSAPPQSQYAFESHFFADTSSGWNVAAATATVKVGYSYQIPRPNIAACDVSDTWPKSTKATFFSEVGYSGIIIPKVTGKFALAMACDAVNNQPNSLYYTKVVLTVTP